MMMPQGGGMMGGQGGDHQDMGGGPQQQGDEAWIDHLRAAIEEAQAAQVAAPDDADSQAIAKFVAGLYAIFAGRQKEQDQALGSPGLMRMLRRG